ncbi:MAG: hypothetical protein P1U38_08925 [Aeromicrobium sp.]|uniref:hypothetical protein n=1 Tax=Aeromicrobium sp. TaxID=1871063 RepID=UPI002608789C|nr:hypothetical protein [Aeromicrobium sp.]MDF1704884.1 hypothetical protein [Aeromicrobium sp.]
MGEPVADLNEQARGVLAIWHDCRDGQEGLYERWYQTEHLPERMAVPGFTVGRRFRAIAADREFLTSYEVLTPEVLSSKPYMDRLAQPTDMTREVMNNAFLHTSRTACSRTSVRGEARGSVILTASIDDPLDLPRLRAAADLFALDHARIHAELWIDAGASAVPSAEGRLRGADERIAAALVLEYTGQEHAKSDVARVAKAVGAARVEVFGLMSVTGPTH